MTEGDLLDLLFFELQRERGTTAALADRLGVSREGLFEPLLKLKRAGLARRVCHHGDPAIWEAT